MQVRSRPDRSRLADEPSGVEVLASA
jgi:hypothetical protein